MFYGKIFAIEILEILTLSGRAMHIWYSGKMHTPPISLTFKFSPLHFKKHIYAMFVIIRLVCYTRKRTDSKHQYHYANILLIKTLTQKYFVKNYKTQE